MGPDCNEYKRNGAIGFDEAAAMALIVADSKRDWDSRFG
jgi:hypothetical protein